MKTNINIMLLAFAAASISLHAGTTPFPAPLPKFMNQEQMAKWNAEEDAAAAKTVSSTQEAPTQFYTGKPYVADADGYLFKYRTYNPEMARWTSADPSGFPDGANNEVYLLNPLSHVDPLGLYNMSEILEGSTTVLGGALSTTAGFIIASNVEAGPLAIAAGAAGIFLGVNAMFLGAGTIINGAEDVTTFVPQSFGAALTLAISQAAGANESTAEGLSTLASALEGFFGPSSEIPGINSIISSLQSDAEQADAYSTMLDGLETLRPATDANGAPGYE